MFPPVLSLLCPAFNMMLPAGPSKPPPASPAPKTTSPLAPCMALPVSMCMEPLLPAPDATPEVINTEPVLDWPSTLVDDSKEMSPTIHYMKKGSGINWHNDYKWKYGATYYINRRWHPQWGGEFMFTDGAGHGWIPVTGNSLVIIKSPIQHKVNPVLTNIMPRISIQMFMK